MTHKFTAVFTIIMAALLITNASFANDLLPRLKHDDGTMNDRVALNTSGITVEFYVPEEQDLVSIQFYGARYETGASMSENFSLLISDSDFQLIRRMEKPLFNVSPGREVWQTLAVAPAVRVNGRFYVTLVYDSRPDRGIYVGLDADDPSGFSKVGLPGTAPTDPVTPGNWMIRARTMDPGTARAATPEVTADLSGFEPDPVPEVVPIVEDITPVRTPVSPTGRPAMSEITSSMGQTGAKYAYRDPHRRLSFVTTAPAIPSGSGRVDVRWNVKPVTVELNYVGKPARVLENLDVTRLVVDFPVPEPGLFNVVIKRNGFQSVSKQFRVVSGSREEWHTELLPVVPPPVIEIIEETPAGGVEPIIEELPSEWDSSSSDGTLRMSTPVAAQGMPAIPPPPSGVPGAVSINQFGQYENSAGSPGAPAQPSVPGTPAEPLTPAVPAQPTSPVTPNVPGMPSVGVTPPVTPGIIPGDPATPPSAGPPSADPPQDDRAPRPRPRSPQNDDEALEHPYVPPLN